MSSRASAKLLVDLRDVEAARGQQYVEVVDEVCGLLDDAFVTLVERGDGELHRLLPYLPRARRGAGVEQRDGVRAFGPFRRTFRDRPPESRSETRDAAGVTCGARRGDAHEQRVAVAVVAQLLHRERVARG